MPLGVWLGQLFVLPMFEEFGVTLPLATQYLLSFYSPFLLMALAVALLLSMFLMPTGKTRRTFVWAAGIAGLIFGLFCIFVIVGPLVSLWRALA